MINGKIDAAVPDEIANLPNWKAPIRIAVHKGRNIGSNNGKFKINGSFIFYNKNSHLLGFT